MEPRPSVVDAGTLQRPEDGPHRVASRVIDPGTRWLGHHLEALVVGVLAPDHQLDEAASVCGASGHDDRAGSASERAKAGQRRWARPSAIWRDSRSGFGSTASTTSSMEQRQIESCAESRSRRATPVQESRGPGGGIGGRVAGTARHGRSSALRRYADADCFHVHPVESTPIKMLDRARAQLAHMAFEPFGRGGGEILGERGDLEAVVVLDGVASATHRPKNGWGRRWSEPFMQSMSSMRNWPISSSWVRDARHPRAWRRQAGAAAVPDGRFTPAVPSIRRGLPANPGLP